MKKIGFMQTSRGVIEVLPKMDHFLDRHVKTDKGEKQLGFMTKRENGIITLVAASHGQEEEYGEKWLKAGSAIEVLYIKKIPLMITVKESGKKHIISEGLAEKIFVKKQ